MVRQRGEQAGPVTTRDQVPGEAKVTIEHLDLRRGDRVIGRQRGTTALPPAFPAAGVPIVHRDEAIDVRVPGYVRLREVLARIMPTGGSDEELSGEA